MSYSGENKYFSFKDGTCESLPNVTLSSSAAAEFGRILSAHFKRFSIGCDGFGHNHILYAVCCGISECGRDVYVCENTDLPSFRFGFPLLSADCGIYVSGSGNSVKISIFNGNRFPINGSQLKNIMNGSPAEISEKNGKITAVTSFRSIYIDNIADSINNINASIPAGISCGNRSVRSLWNEFFTGDDEKIVFQISDDGQRVNAYSNEVGFISHEKLILTYAVILSEKEKEIYIPSDFHYAADFINDENKLKLVRFSYEDTIPEKAAAQRFLYDPLYMCVKLASDRKKFIDTVKKLPQFASVRREVTLDNAEKIPVKKAYSENGGKILISRSGKNRITLVAQAYNSETASELCHSWTEKLRRINLYGDM